jgi:hypothetical protein
MSSPASRAKAQPGHALQGFAKRSALMLAVAAILAGCSAAAPTPELLMSPEGPAGNASESASAMESAAGETAVATDTPTLAPTATPTTAPTATPTTAPTPTKAPTPKPTAKPTPTLPPIAIGLCIGKQLKLENNAWHGDTGTSYANVTATNVSSASCNMRGSSRAQVVDGKGKVIADAGSAAAKVTTSDPVYILPPNGQINTIIQWGNWCKAAPTQKVTVQMVLAFGLGTIKAPAIGDAPIPVCYVKTQGTQVSSEAWLP